MTYPLSSSEWPPHADTSTGKLARLELAFWVFLINFLVIGYYTCGKAFAYLGIVPAKIFIGEIFLVAFFLAWPSGFLSTWITCLIKQNPLTYVAWTQMLFLAYGFFESLRGINFGFSPSVVIMNLVFNFYPVYLFVGFWFERKVPGILDRMIPKIALFNGVYGVLFIVYLNSLPYLIPGTDLAIFRQPCGSVVSLLGLIVLGKRGAYYNFLILLNALVLLGLQVRGDWLGFLVGLLFWGALTGNLYQVFRGGALLTAILVIGLITDFRLPEVVGRGGETSARDMVGRALAGIDKETARQFSKGVDAYAGTLEWRKTWWKEIWIATQADTEKALLGLGYGFPLASLVTYVGDGPSVTRTPHSIFYYALGYSGWIGVILFVAFQIALFHSMWLVYRRTRFSFGLAVFVSTLVAASAGNMLETPFGAIPFYVVIGMCAARQPNDDEAPLTLESESQPQNVMSITAAYSSVDRPRLVEPKTGPIHPISHAWRNTE